MSYGGRIVAICNLLADPFVASLLFVHPNDVALANFNAPLEWSDWWSWAADTDQWLSLVQYHDLYGHTLHTHHALVDSIPLQLRQLITSIRNLQLERHPTLIPAISDASSSSAHGMSPKKAHEVARMVSYISNLLSNKELSLVQHVVDVGAGQGYISRALQDRLGMHVLALDSDQTQTSGAERRKDSAAYREKKRLRKGMASLAENSTHRPRLADGRDVTKVDTESRGSITHKTTHISSETLHTAIDHWIKSEAPDYDPEVGDDASQEPVPILIAALHACGSLTPDVLRSFLSFHADRRSQCVNRGRLWSPSALVVVGCCYNLMSPSDFPLFRETTVSFLPLPFQSLPAAYLHLAAQVPSQWLQNSATLANATLAIRKVVYRALLQPALHKATLEDQTDKSRETKEEGREGTGETPGSRRLGRIHDSAYANWDTFLAVAEDKMGLQRASFVSSTAGLEALACAEERKRMENRLAVLHVLRCFLGPLVESLIILDRYCWIEDALAGIAAAGGTRMGVELVNLFDQATGSGRNVAFVISPKCTDDVA